MCYLVILSIIKLSVCACGGGENERWRDDCDFFEDFFFYLFALLIFAKIWAHASQQKHTRI